MYNLNRIKALVAFDEASANPLRPESREAQISEMISDYMAMYASINFPTTPIHSQKGREFRSFEGEVARLLQEVATAYRSLKIQQTPDFNRALEEIDATEEVYQREEDFIYTKIMPELSKTCGAGEAFLFQLNLFTQNEQILQQSAEDYAKQNKGPYDSTLFFFSALGLISQAKRSYENGHEKEAWLNLVDASFVLGCKRGADVSAKVSELSKAARNAVANAVKKNAPQAALKDYAVQLYIAIRQNGESISVQKATDELFPLVERKLQELSKIQVDRQRKRLSISKPTIYKHLCIVEKAIRNFEVENNQSTISTVASQ